VEDKLAKLGYRLRPRTNERDSRGRSGLDRSRVDRPADDRPGDIAFDDRGNAVYQWKSRHFEGDSKEAEELREQALNYEGLAIVDDEPRPEALIQANPKGTRIGYNPYESGMLEKKAGARKTNLRELSKWIEMKRQLEEKKKATE
jgi:hypothetical protein